MILTSAQSDSQGKSCNDTCSNEGCDRIQTTGGDRILLLWPSVSNYMRNRIIKEGFFRSYELAQLPPLARILFEGLWCMADKEGRLWDRPPQIKAECLPYDECDTDAFLQQLQDAGFILRYEAQDRKCIQILTFGKHQTLTTWESKNTESNIPPSEVRQKSNSRTSKRSRAESKRTEQNREEEIKSIVAPASPDATTDEKVSKSRTAQAVEIFEYWKQQHNRNNRTVFDSKRKRIVEERLKQYPVEFLKQAIRGIKLDPFCSGENPERKVHDELELICRDASHLERYAALDVGKISARASPPVVCQNCHGTGVDTNYDFEKQEDVEIPCRMCDGQKAKAS